VEDRVPGLLLFLPVPAVLVLFTQAPLGIVASVLLGILIMGTHRLYARPFALSRAPYRCLWCGGRARDGSAIEVVEPFGAMRWQACCALHAERLRRVLGFAAAHASFLRVGILGSLLAFLALSLSSGLASRPTLYLDAVALFRLGVAVSVLPLGWLGEARGSAAEPTRAPFPVHIQALLGTAPVLWLFRLVGLVWLLLGVAHVMRRIGLAAL
jgi:hypothetical protein